MKKPLVAVITFFADEKYSIPKSYIYALKKSGLIPLPIISCPEDITHICNIVSGILFSGGDDVDPSFYGEEKSEKCVGINIERDIFEIALYNEAVKRKLPMLGICRGCQLLNVAAGGTLYQHIENHLRVTHDVYLEKNSLLHKNINLDTVQTNSIHHQAVKKLGKDFISIASSDFEGGRITEAFTKNDSHFVLGIQWHPERTYDDDSLSRIIFDLFSSACNNYQQIQTAAAF